MPQSKRWVKWAITVLLLGLIMLSWSKYLDDAANTATLSNFKRALAVAAIARGFNGVISVAQGTEVAVQPIGIGVTLTIGEILDPLNDLIERFSALALVASVSLGLQLTLSQMVASAWLSGIMSAAVLAYLILLWIAPGRSISLGTHTTALRVAGTCIFVRFLLAVVMLTTHFVDATFLAAQQDDAVAKLASASTHIERLQDQPAIEATVAEQEGSFLDRTAAQIGNFLDASSQTLDLKSQLQKVEEQVENSVEEIIKLIVIFLLQTLVFPIATLWLCWWALQAFWRWSKLPVKISS